MNTLFDLKRKIDDIERELTKAVNWLVDKAADPSVEMEEINKKEVEKEALVKRINILQAEYDSMEAKQREDAKKQSIITGNPEKDMITAKAAFYKAALTGGDVRKAYEGLGAIPVSTADLGYGEHLLPTNMENELIVEPFETNSLRTIQQVSQVTGLEEPKLAFTIDENALADVTDQNTANEIAMTGDVVTYGRFKTKVVATVKDTVLHGTPTNLVSTIDNALKSGLAMKEKMNAFSTTADNAHQHMSFYMKGITTIAGDNIIDAIIKALGDLPDGFSENASVVMRRSDYFAAIQTLANSNATLWGMKPEDVIGYPVIFNDRAVVPVIGDFRYSRMNYDIGTIFETDKDAKKGEYYFVMTAWGDHQIKLASAFRLAYVRVQIIGATTDKATVAAAGTVKAQGLVFNDGESGAGGTITYQWQKFTTEWEDISTGTGYNQATYTTAAAGSIRCKVTFTDADGVSSVYTRVVEVTAN